MKSTLVLIIFMLSGSAIAQYPPPYIHKAVHMKVKMGDTTLMQEAQFDEYLSDGALGLFKFDSMYIAHDDASFFVTSNYNAISIYTSPIKVGTFIDTIRVYITYFSANLGGIMERWHYYPVSIEVENASGTVSSIGDKLPSVVVSSNTISISNPSEKFVSMELVDLLGRKILTSERPKLYLHSTPPGSYFILVRLKDGVVVKKIVN